MKIEKWRKAAWLLQTRPGRLELRRRYSHRLWPLTSRLAQVYRSTLARRTRLVMVSGSVGKTTTMRAVACALGVPVRALAALSANSYSAFAAELLHIRPWQRRAVVEVGLYGPGEMARYAAVARPDVAVMTAVASDHFRSFRSIEAIRDEKGLLVAALPPQGVAVLNADDPHVREMAKRTSARVVWFGADARADVRASEIEIDWPRGMRLTVALDGRRHQVSTRLIGRHMTHAVLAALTVALVEGVPIETAIERLAALEPTPGRMYPLQLTSGAVALMDDMKGSEATFASALGTLAELPARRRLVVLGAIDDYAGGQHAAFRKVGETVGRVADRVIVVGPFLKRYRGSLMRAGLDSDAIVEAVDVHAALEALREANLGTGDVVLVKGRNQQALARVGLGLAGRDVRCRADPCPFRRRNCSTCPLLERDFDGLPARVTKRRV